MPFLFAITALASHGVRTLFAWRQLCCALWLPCLLLLAVDPALAGRSEQEFNLQDETTPKERVLDLIFGSPPPLASERGILIIRAFHDKNGNAQRDREEASLNRQVSCLVDDIEYTVPAFIPGLEYNTSYQVTCAGTAFSPSVDSKTVFIEQRGQVIQLDLPCQTDAAPQAAYLPTASSRPDEPVSHPLPH